MSTYYCDSCGETEIREGESCSKHCGYKYLRLDRRSQVMRDRRLAEPVECVDREAVRRGELAARLNEAELDDCA
jgi:hypothetical protein